MIQFEEALEIVMSNVRSQSAEQVDMQDAYGRILAEDVVSDMDMPPFDKSAMDGYACRLEDLDHDLSVLETIPAGALPTKTVGLNQCSKIMTGAPVPQGADCVVMVEYTEDCGEGMVRFTGKGTKSNICKEGEDLRIGDLVLKKGSLILDRHISVLASVGKVRPLVVCQPRVGLIATGDELVEPAVVPGPSQIRNSNASQLTAQLRAIGLTAIYYGVAGDDEEKLTALIKQASEENDVLLISGGVSMGDYDFVPDALKEQGFDLLFEKVAIKPGKPTVFGKSDTCFCFGMPGNPVSTYVLFENLVKPFLYKMMEHDFMPAVVSMKLGKAVRRKKTARAEWLPVVMRDHSTVEPLEYHGSAHITAMTSADGLICIPIGVSELEEGSIVDVRQI